MGFFTGSEIWHPDCSMEAAQNGEMEVRPVSVVNPFSCTSPPAPQQQQKNQKTPSKNALTCKVTILCPCLVVT